MAVTPVTFYDPSSPFGELTGWEIQTGGDPAKSQQQEIDYNRTGDILAGEKYDKRSTVSATYKPSTRTSGDSMYLPSVGEILESYHVDSVSIAFGQTTSPTLTVAGHQHDDGSGHADGSCRTYSATPNFIVQGIGIPMTISDIGATEIFALTLAAAVGLRSLTYTLTCTHEDELDSAGAHLAGENRDGVETLEIEFTGGAIETIDYTLAANWFVGTETPAQGNTTVKTKSITATQHIEKDT